MPQMLTYKPLDAYRGTSTSSTTKFQEASIGYGREFGDRKKRFLAYDGVELVFRLAWRNKETGPWETIKYWLTYYMATQEVEVVEEKGQRIFMSNPHLLRRSRLPRTIMPHDDRARMVDPGDMEKDYYHEDDLVVGSTIMVYGREMVTSDCPAETAAWYADNYGIDQKEHVVDISEPPVVPIVHRVPPHNGFGSEEDTLNSLKSLMPKPPKLDVRTITGVRKRWKARLVTDDAVDKGRDFRITYYVDPKEVTVLEPPIRNSGVLGGLFLRRMKLRNPTTGVYFELKDFVVGGEVTINAHTFTIYDTELLS